MSDSTPLPPFPANRYAAFKTDFFITHPLNMPTSALSQRIKNEQQNGTEAPLARTVSKSNSYISASPTDTFHHPRKSFSVEGTSPLMRRSTVSGAALKVLKPFREEDIKILLLENVNQTGVEILQGQGYQVETLKSSLPEDQLIEKIK
jgi:hypothetical protein